MLFLKTCFYSISVFLLAFNAQADICDDWFAKSKIKKDKNCLSRCVIRKVDMGTFVCRSVCNKLCDSKIAPEFLFNVSALYPGLTDLERALLAEYPKEALIVYQQKAKAESTCSDLFDSNETNDESDACRHYLWAAHLANKLGADMAQKFLNAHEQESHQPENEKGMDLANNRAGILLAEKLVRSKIFDDDKVVEGFKSALKNKELVVLKPKKNRIDNDE